MIPGRGPQHSPLMVVLDYPSKEELTSRTCCAGSVERLLKNYFHDNGANLENYYKTFYIKEEFHWPRGAKERKAALEKINFRQWNSLLQKEISDIQPNVILSVGEQSTKFLTGRTPVNKLRGSILGISQDARNGDCNTRVIPILAPRDIFQKWTHDTYTKLDVGRALSLRNRTDEIKEDYLLWICWSVKALDNWWSDRGRYAEFLTLDIETMHGFVTCISFCADGKEAFSIPLVDGRTTKLDRALIFKLVAQILKSQIPKVNQNIRYDDHMHDYWGFQIANIAGDTMLLSHCIYPELPKGLDFLTTLYTEIPYYKDEGRDFTPKQGMDVLYYYNAKDALACWRIYKAQIEDAKEEGVWDFYQKKVFPLYDIYKRSDERGIRIDETERTMLRTKYEELLDGRVRLLRDLSARPDINYNSPKQICNLVYEEFKLPKQWHYDATKGTKTLSTDEETLEELILSHTEDARIQEVLWTILWCRKLHKVLGYINVNIHNDGRIRKITKLTGTKSGRTSNSETVDTVYLQKGQKFVFENLGLPFQTIPKHGFEVGTERIGKDIRKMYVASPGYTFVEGDGGQAEARVVCVLAEDWDALAEMNRKDFARNAHGLKDDIHTKTAMLVTGKEFPEITESDRQDFGKKPRHAGNYDMGAKRLSLMAHISFVEASTVLSRFHQAVPKIRETFHWYIRSIVSNKRILSTPHGRRRQFFGKLNDDLFKEAYSYIPQAVVSDHTKFTTIRPLAEAFPDAWFLSESHDSATFEVRDYEVEKFIDAFKRAGETPIDFSEEGSLRRDCQLVIPVEIKTGCDWYNMKEVR
jgi:uracil-DNA glycosylase family 4